MNYIVDDVILFFIILIGFLFISTKNKDYKVLLPLLFLQTFTNVAYFMSNMKKESDFIALSGFSLFLPLFVITVFCFYENMNLKNVNYSKKTVRILKFIIFVLSLLFLVITTMYILESYKNINILPKKSSNINENINVNKRNNLITAVNSNYVLIVYILIVFLSNFYKNMWNKNEK